MTVQNSSEGVNSGVHANSVFVIFVNGEKIEHPDIQPEWTLIYFIREKLNLKGSKVACGEGGCGSCTVLLSKYDTASSKYSHKAINACITPLCSLYGCHILTVEGISDGNKSCHSIQDSIARNNGTQCGFCSPGMVMSMYALSAEKINEEKLEIKTIKDALQGNLCRCTGYRPILDAFKDYQPNCSNSADIEDTWSLKNIQCENPRTINNNQASTLQAIENLLKGFENGGIKIGDSKYLKFKGKNSIWFLPYNLDEALQILNENSTARLIGGSTQLFQNLESTCVENPIVLVDKIRELRAVERCEFEQRSFLKLGAALTISEMADALQIEIEQLHESQTRGFRSIVQLLNLYGSTQVRNSATIGGSIMTTNPASDIQTFYQVLDCWAHQINIGSNSLMTKKMKLPFKAGSLITHLEIPHSKDNEYIWMDKVTKRRKFDAAILNAAAKLTTDDSKTFVQNLVLCFGGIAVIRFDVDFVFERNQVSLNEAFLAMVTTSVVAELNTKLRKTQYSEAYISALTKNLLLKFYRNVTSEIQGKPLPHDDENIFKSSQLFRLDKESKPNDLIGQPIAHASAYKHATGEAQYCDDVPKIDNELFLAFVCSDRAHAEVISVDPTAALAVTGVVGYVSHQDVSKNSFGMVIDDEEIFASSKVTSHGQIIGGIVAEDRIIAQKAAKLVKVEYRNIVPLMLTIEDAIQNSSYYPEQGMKLKRLIDHADTIDKCDNVLEGKMYVGNQAHFYMEPQGCIVIPKEDNEMDVISSTQNPMEVQKKIGEALNIPSNRIIVRVKRIGGGFGGKESRCLLVALPAAVAAHKFKRPVRCILDRQLDMRISGKRHTFLTDYKIGFTNSGRLLGLKMTVYCNGGATLDISEAAIERVLVNLDNAYNIPNYDLDGIVCKTHVASNTVMRGTGGPQAALLIEGILDRIAGHLNLDPVQVRRLNMYVEGDVTPYGQTLTNCTVQRCWDECVKLSEYYSRRDQVDQFNRNNKLVKRGLSMNPCHFGIAYTAVFLNQGAALVHIYRDGSVLISHGGVEIGQGLHTKLLQVATRELGIEASKIYISETSTDKVPNATPTSASCGSDLFGMAVMYACQELMQRLAPFRKQETDSWESIVSAAYFDRVSLSATGFYKTPKVGWNSQKVGSPFNYYSTGAACTEVELDCLTGEHKILRTDIVMDVGQSLNPAIDIGQIEGAYAHGIGLFTSEELVFSEQGELLTVGPNSYKIPTVGSIPLELNVSILPGSSNPHAIYSSKAIGEPPLLLATSVFYAIKDCIRTQRRSTGKSADFRLDSPATPEKILMALEQSN
ncbi:unnamed protein product [Allacma fusca]|uniref:Xanthine dehydrogenase n=1 Tax=Allacma fusca TaxID=39272 RepID=A0A8J2JNW7_9HEXA|nr:unnamed protein product [Allacma fusca]